MQSFKTAKPLLSEMVREDIEKDKPLYSHYLKFPDIDMQKYSIEEWWKDKIN